MRFNLVAKEMTSPLPYDICLKLKEAGWPQPEFSTDHCHPLRDINGVRWFGQYVYENDEKWDQCYDTACYSPSLEELIEACGDRFGKLVKCNDYRSALAPREESGRRKPGGWEAETDEEQGDYLLTWAETDKEAVANLWLKLRATVTEGKAHE